MAVNFIARKCACGGKLEFDPLKKIWVCMYCGTVIEREATFDKVSVDGIEGINDVVRQTLLDVAYKRMDSAQENLEDCERKNHGHIGTLLATLSVSMAKITLTKDQNEARNIMEMIKFNAKRLKEEFPVINVEEINLYESFGNAASDIYANLALVFDTLKDAGRLDYITSKMKASEIFSVDANRNLLRLAIKQGKLQVVEEILNNVNNIDRETALEDILNGYPDNEKKRSILFKLIRQGSIKIDAKVIEDYFINSTDSVNTKNTVLEEIAALKRSAIQISTASQKNAVQEVADIMGLRIKIQAVLAGICRYTVNYEEAKKTFDILCKEELRDNELEELMEYALLVGQKYETALACLEALQENGCYVKLNAKVMADFLSRKEYGNKETAAILKKLLLFDLDNRNLDGVINCYLCELQDNRDRRKQILSVLLSENAPISIGTVENYTLRTVTDGMDKTEVLKQIFHTGFHKTYVSDLLSQYIMSSADQPGVKEEVVNLLLSEGFVADSKVLNQYISSEADTSTEKEERIKKLIDNGTQVRSDSLDTYLMSLKKESDYSPRLFKLLAESSYQISEKALVNYLLLAKEVDKVNNCKALFEDASFDLNTAFTETTHLGSRIEGNLFQIYLLSSADAYDTAKAIAAFLNEKKVKLNNEIRVNGNIMKFKKYLGEYKSSLSSLTLQLADEYRMFSFF
ncbi:MAG: hypothetical protein K0R05_1778 [Anaerocolumna sp.]|jgi:hypothetical protein|nr:hypothetical protein [Anaerocolumna sp.]